MKTIKRVLRKWLGPWLNDNQFTIVINADTKQATESLDRLAKRIDAVRRTMPRGGAL